MCKSVYSLISPSMSKHEASFDSEWGRVRPLPMRLRAHNPVAPWSSGSLNKEKKRQIFTSLDHGKLYSNITLHSGLLELPKSYPTSDQ